MTADLPIKMDRAGKIDRFEATEPEIALLKAWFLVKSPSKLLLRKGEDFGGFALQVVDALLRGPDVMASYYNHYLGNPHPGPVELQELIDGDTESIIRWYLYISKSMEMAAKQFRWFLKHVQPWVGKGGGQTRESGNRDFRILCWPDKRNERARSGWEREGIQVRHYKLKKDAGSHRLYIGNGIFAVFYRTGDRFFGLRGSDEATSDRLSELFQDEWNKAKTPRP